MWGLPLICLFELDFALQSGIEGSQRKDLGIIEQKTSCEERFCKVGWHFPYQSPIALNMVG